MIAVSDILIGLNSSGPEYPLKFCVLLLNFSSVASSDILITPLFIDKGIE